MTTETPAPDTAAAPNPDADERCDHCHELPEVYMYETGRDGIRHAIRYSCPCRE